MHLLQTPSRRRGCPFAGVESFRAIVTCPRRMSAAMRMARIERFWSVVLLSFVTSSGGILDSFLPKWLIVSLRSFAKS